MGIGRVRTRLGPGQILGGLGGGGDQLVVVAYQPVNQSLDVLLVAPALGAELDEPQGQHRLKPPGGVLVVLDDVEDVAGIGLDGPDDLVLVPVEVLQVHDGHSVAIEDAQALGVFLVLPVEPDQGVPGCPLGAQPERDDVDVAALVDHVPAHHEQVLGRFLGLVISLVRDVIAGEDLHGGDDRGEVFQGLHADVDLQGLGRVAEQVLHLLLPGTAGHVRGDLLEHFLCRCAHVGRAVLGFLKGQPGRDSGLPVLHGQPGGFGVVVAGVPALAGGIAHHVRDGDFDRLQLQHARP